MPLLSGPIPKAIEDRFWSKVDTHGECWEWTAARASNGYGVFQYAHKHQERAHRLSYLMEHGRIREGLLVLHHCDNRACVRPSHLYAGTQRENVRDAHARRRGARGTKVNTNRLTESEVAEVVARLNAGEPTTRIASSLGVHTSCIRYISKQRSWKYLFRSTDKRFRIRRHRFRLRWEQIEFLGVIDALGGQAEARTIAKALRIDNVSERGLRLAKRGFIRQDLRHEGPGLRHTVWHLKSQGLDALVERGLVP